MTRDSKGAKIGRNEPCWCGSGRKFKACHINREFQPTSHYGAYENSFYKAEKYVEYCSCEIGESECSGTIIKAHSVSKSSALSEGAVKGHVSRLTVDVSPESAEAYDAAYFEKVGVGLASVFRAFCEHHDNELFRELDQMDLSSKEKYFWELFYRSLCFERYRKKVADRVVPEMRDLDKGKKIHDQALWQDYVSRQIIAHRLGGEALDNFRKELEAMYRAKSYVADLAYF